MQQQPIVLSQRTRDEVEFICRKLLEKETTHQVARLMTERPSRKAA